MNNIIDLRNCIDSIDKFNKNVEYQIIVIAYLFSKENLEKIQKEYPKVEFIVNDNIAGYSENHNLALKSATGEYSLIINDDTYFTDNSLEILESTLKSNSDIQIISPIILNIDGTIQINGRSKYTPINWFLNESKISKVLKLKSKYENKSGIYETYNLSGACFLIRTEVLKEIGYLDERYFFTPEDIHLSTFAKSKGFGVYVNTNAHIYHINSSTAKRIHQIIIPVGKHGHYLYFQCFYGKSVEYFVRISSFIISSFKYVFWKFSPSSERRDIMLEAHKNVVKYAFMNIFPKELFITLKKKYKL
jgi:GT2 family glycosyltransferase